MTKNNPPKLLIDIFSDWADGKGIFSEMTNMPWSDTVDADLLDMDYFGNHSGWKKGSPLVYKLIEDDGISDANRKKLADLAVAKFGPNWAGLWTTYHSQYPLLQDYQITETGSSSGSDSRSKTIDHSGENGETNTETLQHGHVITTGQTGSASSNEGRYGYNSTEAVPTDTHSETSTASTTQTNSGTDTNSATKAGTDSYSDEQSESGEKEDEYSKTISGYRGTYTRQSIIRQEREIWMTDFFSGVYKDVDTILASMIYNREHKTNPFWFTNFGYYNI